MLLVLKTISAGQCFPKNYDGWSGATTGASTKKQEIPFREPPAMLCYILIFLICFLVEIHTTVPEMTSTILPINPFIS